MFLSVLLVLLSGCLYGSRTDRSCFISANLLDDGRVLFSFQELVYCPAQGLAAFPDGGIPKYKKDNNALFIFDPASGALRLLMREKNHRWEHGQGSLFVMKSCGNVALVSQGGQVRGKPSSSIRHWLVDVGNGRTQELELKENFAREGRDVGAIYLVSSDGTLVFVNNPLVQEDGRSSKRRDEGPSQIWVRRPDGKIVKAGDGPHYEGYVDGSVIYWVEGTRQFIGYRVNDNTRRTLHGYRTPLGLPDVTRGVSVSSGGSGMELGNKVGDSWKYEPLPVTSAQVLKKM